MAYDDSSVKPMSASLMRARIAKNANLPSYREYAFRSKGRFDYTPKECKVFHETVAKLVVPLARDLQRRRARASPSPRSRPASR